jgi:hypothetical protein
VGMARHNATPSLFHSFFAEGQKRLAADFLISGLCGQMEGANGGKNWIKQWKRRGWETGENIQFGIEKKEKAMMKPKSNKMDQLIGNIIFIKMRKMLSIY